MGKFFLNESNRWKHVWMGFLTGLILTVVGALLVGHFTEVRDKKAGGRYDKLDLWATAIGGLLGTAVLAFFIWFYLQSGVWNVLLFLVCNVGFVWAFGAYFEGWAWLPRAVYGLTIGMLKEHDKL